MELFQILTHLVWNDPGVVQIKKTKNKSKLLQI